MKHYCVFWIRSAHQHQSFCVVVIIGIIFPIGFYTCYNNYSANLDTQSHSNSPTNDVNSILREKCESRKMKPITALDDLLQLPENAEIRTLNEVNNHGEGMAQDDPSILKYIWHNCEILLRPPDGKPTTYKAVGRASMGQDKIVRRILKNMTGGFFVEAGAYDGVTSSNTLEFERDFGWQGLLIEADANKLVKLHNFHRNAWISHSCLAGRDYPHEVMFQPDPESLGRISSVISAIDKNNATNTTRNHNSNITKTHQEGNVKLQCFPLYSYLAALNVTVVDFLSLDVEGDELKILKTIPFHKVLIRVVAVEIVTSAEGQGPYREFMKSKGFRTLGQFYHGSKPFDLIFVHNSIKNYSN